MLDYLAGHGLQFGGYAIELGLVMLLLSQGRWKRLRGPLLYTAALFGLDGLARPAILDYYGIRSLQYRYAYWTTDLLLALGAFLLIVAFFRRACERRMDLWPFLRRLLASVFLLSCLVSGLSLLRNHSYLTTPVPAAFEQNLYFACLVLNTLLYVMMQHIKSPDEELGLLVCGLGIQFAGPAANFALIHLTLGHHGFISLYNYFGPLCTLGMLLTWLYAVTRAPEIIPARRPRNYSRVPVLAD